MAYARTHSAHLAGRYRNVPESVPDVAQLPVVTKAEMMRHFDKWVTDPLVNREQVEAFIAHPTLIGPDYLGRYVVCTTSGQCSTRRCSLVSPFTPSSGLGKRSEEGRSVQRRPPESAHMRASFWLPATETSIHDRSWH